MLKKVPARLLLESLKRERELLDNLDFLIAHVVLSKDRMKLWEIRQEILEILEKDLFLKIGVV